MFHSRIKMIHIAASWMMLQFSHIDNFRAFPRLALGKSSKILLSYLHLECNTWFHKCCAKSTGHNELATSRKTQLFSTTHSHLLTLPLSTTLVFFTTVSFSIRLLNPANRFSTRFLCRQLIHFSTKRPFSPV
jgi:hypothetical protein